MRSLRSTLTAGLLAVGSFLLLLSLAASYWLANGILERQFDRGLLERASVLATLLEQVGERVELHFADEVMPYYAASERPEYFQLWIEERVLERSVSLVLAGEAELPRLVGGRSVTRICDLDLPDGRAGRAIGLTTPVHHYAPDPVSGADPGPADVLVVVAIERADLQAAVRNLLLGVVGFGILLVIPLVFLGTKMLALALRPLDRLSQELARIESQERSAEGLATLELPSELTPVAQRIGSLTTTLQHALERERRTTANIAHELRTPIAELRTVTDVALQTPDDVQAMSHAVAESRDIAAGMHGMVSTLLALARSRSGNGSLAKQSIDLVDVVRQLWLSFEPRAKERGLAWSFNVETPVSAVSLNDETLRAVLSNLFDNACSHARYGSRAECTLQSDAREVRVLVRNAVEGLAEEELARFTEPFWRADEARSDRDHSGLGLALAKECARAAGLGLTFRLQQDFLLAAVSIPRS